MRNEDGSYTTVYPQQVTLAMCYTKPATWRERWTAYPEQGGKFIERIEER